MIDIEHIGSEGVAQRIRRVAPGTTRRDAEAFELQLRAELTAAAPKNEEEKRPLTLAEFAPEFLANARANNKPSTVTEKATALERHLIPAFGTMRLDEIGTRNIEMFKARKLEEGLAPKTVNNLLVILRRLLAVACEYEVLGAVPRIKRLKEAEPEFDFLDFDEADRLVTAAAHEPEWQRAIVVTLHTGLRRGELIALRWDDVDLVAGRMIVRRAATRGHVDTPKSGRKREIPLNRTALTALKEQRHLRGPFVFPREDGSMRGDDDFFPPLRRATRRAGLREIGWHVLRHTFASHLTMRGGKPREVQELLGHSDIKVTMRYAHLSPAVKRDAVALLEARTPLGTRAAHGDGDE